MTVSLLRKLKRHLLVQDEGTVGERTCGDDRISWRNPSSALTQPHIRLAMQEGTWIDAFGLKVRGI